MTLQSYPSHSEEVVASGASSSSSSASTSSTDVCPLPLSIGQKEIVLSNDERALIAELPDVNLLAPGANINITDSTNVDVGNRTTFNRDVTIYQIIQGSTLPEIQNGVAGHEEVVCNKNGQVVNSENKPTTPKSFPKDFKKLLRDRPTQLWIAGILLALMSIISLIVYYSVNFSFAQSPVAPSPGHTDDLGDGIQVIQRSEWLARAPLNFTKVTHPLPFVRIMHTGGSYCKDYQSCANKVLAMQGWQVASKGMPDLAYNYMIGGDGNVYVGRGPDVENEWMHEAIDIGYIGNFLGPYDKMTDKMNEAGRRLIVWLRQERYITPDYKVIAQNQTMNTQSPGENIYKRIVKWPHYDSGLYFL